MRNGHLLVVNIALKGGTRLGADLRLQRVFGQREEQKKRAIFQHECGKFAKRGFAR